MTAETLLLATDLDGTFLGGTDEQRDALYADLAARRDVLLVYVTGRDIDFIADLIGTPGMPRPRYIIGDVGTSVYDGMTLLPIAELEAEIAARWQQAARQVIALLEGEPGLRLQPTPFRHRVSYDCDPQLLSPQTIAKIQAAGFDCLISADRFLDVLPAGVSKGPTLARLVDSLGFDRERVLVAGDTMNDLSLFETGFKGVAVGNAEAALIEALDGRPSVYRSPLPGAAGISDALRHYGFDDAAISSGDPA
jgi:hydroxymethylpyrimidine pyrophosphatase-like HAD family hydrolase